MGVITLRPLTFGLLLFCLGHFVPATFCAQSNCLPLFRLLEIFCLVILSRSSLSPVQKSSLRWYWWSGCRLDFTLKILRSNSSKTDPLPTLRILALCYICMWDVYAQEHYIFEMIKLPIFGTYYLLFAVFFLLFFAIFRILLGEKGVATVLILTRCELFSQRWEFHNLLIYTSQWVQNEQGTR
jgi:hypothetical protein